jgi:hypothetical protein
MTILAYTLKNIIELVPEVVPMIKQANVDQEFPLDSKDSTLATALQVKYFEKIAYHPVEFTTLEKIAKAVHIYGLDEDVKNLSNKMVKAAHAATVESSINKMDGYLAKQASFLQDCTEVKPRVEVATQLYKEAKDLGLTPSDDVICYSGNGYLNKEAALKALTVRYDATKDINFVKVAKVLVDSQNDTRLREAENLVKVANLVDTFDKNNKLQLKGFDFYKEVFITKEAAFKSMLMVKLAGKDIPYENIERVGHTRIAQYIGKDVADEMNGGPENFKVVAETLPLDLQHVLVSLTKNV